MISRLEGGGHVVFSRLELGRPHRNASMSSLTFLFITNMMYTVTSFSVIIYPMFVYPVILVLFFFFSTDELFYFLSPKDKYYKK